MLSMAAGYDTGYLTDQISAGRENYYTGSVDMGTEPAGVWHGRGADLLGLSGEVHTPILEAVYHRLRDPRDASQTLGAPHKQYRSAEEIYAGLLAGEPHATPERRLELERQAKTSARQALAFEDMTFGAPKSVSVLGVALERAAVEAEQRGDAVAAEGWREHHRAVEEAVMVGAQASIDYLEEVAGYGRVGKHGSGADRWQDAHHFVVASFLQHDSRDKDPHLHVHNIILNRQLCADGVWRGLDVTALKIHRGAAGAIGERAMEESLARTLGVRFATRPDGKAREIVGVDQTVMDLFSSRRRAISPEVARLVAAYTAKYGREPGSLQRKHMAQQATLTTRRAKSHAAETVEARLQRWETEIQATLSSGLSAVATSVFNRRQDAGPVDQWSPQDVIERALARVTAEEATWTRSFLMRAVSDALPGHLGIPADEVRPLLEQLTDQALEQAVRITPEADLSDRPAEYRLDDGSDVFARPGSGMYAGQGQLAAERVLRGAAAEQGFEKAGAGEVEALLGRYAANGHPLGPDQAAALRGVMTSGARVEVVTSAAGCGKSFVMGALADGWQERGRRVVGLAPSQNASDVLADEGVAAVNIDRWLRSGNDDTYQVGAGDIVVVDEAGMASTQQLRAVHERCQRVGAKMLLVGDPRQLGAVGPGGGFADVAERAPGYELVEVRRFAEPWEARASLALRDGDLTALADYDQHGRIVDGGTGDQAEAKALRAWLGDTLSGRESLLLAGSNESAARMSGAARAELVRLGRVPEQGVQLGKDGNIAGVGDLVQARQNAWGLASAHSRAPINRSAYRVTGTCDDGGLVVEPVGGQDRRPITLPASYVAQHLTLGYASTVHAAQGRTVDRTHSVISAGWDTPLAYVGLTRGRESNTAWVVTRQTPEDSPPGQAQAVRPRSGYAVLADVLGRDNAAQRSALEEQRQAEELAASTFTTVGQLLDGIGFSTRGQTSGLLDRLAADGSITETQRAALAADDAMGSVERLLRAAEVDGHDRETVLAAALGGRSLAGAEFPGRVLHHRLQTQIGDLHATIDSHRDLIPDSVLPYHRQWLEGRADAADARRHELGARTAEDPPAWALEALGPVPDDVLEREEWETKAGWAQAYREMAGHDDEQDPLGQAPPAGLAEKHAIWRTAHQHLGLVDRGPEEGEMSDGQLRARVAAFERERNWAPAAVRDQLGLAHRARDAAETDAVLRDAHQDPTAGHAREQVETLDGQIPDLDEADRARQAWQDETAETRTRAERARAELDARGVDVDDPDGRVTAGEWLEAHRAEQTVEDAHREVDQLTEDVEDLAATPVDDTAAETQVPDARDTEPDEHEHTNRADKTVSTEQTRAAVNRAQAAMAEIHNRETEPSDDYYSHDDEQTDVDVAEYVMD